MKQKIPEQCKCKSNTQSCKRERKTKQGLWCIQEAVSSINQGKAYSSNRNWGPYLLSRLAAWWGSTSTSAASSWWGGSVSVVATASFECPTAACSTTATTAYIAINWAQGLETIMEIYMWRVRITLTALPLASRTSSVTGRVVIAAKITMSFAFFVQVKVRVHIYLKVFDLLWSMYFKMFIDKIYGVLEKENYEYILYILTSSRTPRTWELPVCTVNRWSVMSSHQSKAQHRSSTNLTQDSCNDNKEERNNKLMVHIFVVLYSFGGCSSLL